MSSLVQGDAELSGQPSNWVSPPYLLNHSAVAVVSSQSEDVWLYESCFLVQTNDSL